MARRYLIETPMQLRMLAEFCVYGADSDVAAHIRNIATVWNAFRNKGRAVAWDKQMFVAFAASAGQRAATVLREDGAKPGSGVTEAQLKYNPALAFCRENLTELSTAKEADA